MTAGALVAEASDASAEALEHLGLQAVEAFRAQGVVHPGELPFGQLARGVDSALAQFPARDLRCPRE